MAHIGPSTTNRRLAKVLDSIRPLRTEDESPTRIYLLNARQEQALQEAWERINETPDER